MIVLGADVSTTRLALADTSGKSASLILRSSKSGEWLQDTYHRSGVFARQFINGRPVMAVFVETPMGRVPSPLLLMTTGVVMAGVYEALRGLYAHPVTVCDINVSTWKKLAVGSGKADKAQIMAWALALGAKPANQDEADALGVAMAGATLIEPVAA